MLRVLFMTADRGHGRPAAQPLNVWHIYWTWKMKISMALTPGSELSEETAETRQNGEGANTRGPHDHNRRCHHLIRQATGVSNQTAGVGNYMTATRPMSTVCGNVPYWQEMHEVSRNVMNTNSSPRRVYFHKAAAGISCRRRVSRGWAASLFHTWKSYFWRPRTLCFLCRVFIRP